MSTAPPAAWCCACRASPRPTCCTPSACERRPIINLWFNCCHVEALMGADMTHPLHHPHEPTSNGARDVIARLEPKALRTFTPTQAVLAKSAGIYHWTPEGRRLYDFTSGVLVSNLGHNPSAWMKRYVEYLGWS